MGKLHKERGWPRFGDQGRMLVAYLRPQRARVVLLALLLFGSIGLQLFNPQILKQFIDSATHGASDQTLAAAAGLFLAIALIQQAASVAATYLSENIGWTATNAVRADLLLHCLRMDASFHKTRTPGELIERIDGDVSAIADFFARFVVYVVGNSLFLLGVLVLLFVADWRIGSLLAVFAQQVAIAIAQKTPRAGTEREEGVVIAVLRHFLFANFGLMVGHPHVFGPKFG